MRKRAGNTWLKKNRNDIYYKKAKQQNYRARSIFKLEQLNNKFNILKVRGKNALSILDIGCAPGSWLQWLSQKIMPETQDISQNIIREKHKLEKKIDESSANDSNQKKEESKTITTIKSSNHSPQKLLVGVDLTTIKPIEGVEFHRGNIFDDSFIDELVQLYSQGFQVILSDAAYKTIGNQDTDHARQIGLAERVLFIADRLLLPGGNCLIKIFEGVDALTFLKEHESKFERAKLSKPDASRKESKEIYFIGKGFEK